MHLSDLKFFGLQRADSELEDRAGDGAEEEGVAIVVVDGVAHDIAAIAAVADGSDADDVAIVCGQWKFVIVGDCVKTLCVIG